MIVTRENFMDAFDEMQRLAVKTGAVVYTINVRNAGMGITWHELKRTQPAPFNSSSRALGDDNWENGLIIYSYHGDLIEMVQAELDRLEAAQDEQEVAANATDKV